MRIPFLKKSYLPLYYLMLFGALLVIHTSSTPIRALYLMALFIPIIFNTEYLPAVIVAFVGTSHYTSEEVPLLLINDRSYYLILTSFVVLWQIIRNKVKSINPIFIIMIVYVISVDLLSDGEISDMVLWWVLSLFLFIIASSDYKGAGKFLPYAFILLSTGVSYLILTNLGNLEVHHLAGNVDRYEWWDDPNYVGTVISMGVTVIAVIVYQNRPRPLFLAVYAGLLLLFVFGILTMGSRGALLSTLVPIAVLLLFEVFEAKSAKAKLLTILSSILIGSFVVYIVVKNGWFELMQYRIDEGVSTGGGRTLIWQDKLNTFLSESSIVSFLFGYGHNGGYALGIFHNNDAFHNDYVAFFVMYGLVGFCLFMFALLYPIRRSNKRELPQVLALMSNIMVTSLSLEPFSNRHYVYIAFYMAILIRIKSDNSATKVHS